MKKIKKVISVNNPENAIHWFFTTYNPDKWLIKINFLKKSFDNLDNIYEYIKYENSEKEVYENFIKEELHFLIYPMIETLFELIFALKDFNEYELPYSLTFVNDKRTLYYSKSYRKIKKYSKGKINLLKESPFLMNERHISYLRKIFYFNVQLEKNDEIIDENLLIINKILIQLAKKFVDREEYNAYKHSSRESNQGYKIDLECGTQKTTIIDSRDAIHYFTSKEYENNIRLRTAAKTFDFEIDYEVALIIYQLIFNIFNTRKSIFLKEDITEKGIYIFQEENYNIILKSFGEKFIVDI